MSNTRTNWMQPSEVMERFGISRATMNRWIRTGKLPRTVRIGQRTWFAKSSIDRAERLMIERAEASLKA